MTRIERKRYLQTAAMGFAITLLAALLDVLGGFETIEPWLYDWRARRFQFHTPAPSGKLVHLDIDDAALEGVGRWPWPRTYIARILDELRLAGAEMAALDILLPESTEDRFVPDPEGNIPHDKQGRPIPIDDDRVLADAITRWGRVLVPVSMDLTPKDEAGPVEKEIRRRVAKDVTLDMEAARQDLLDSGLLKARDLGQYEDVFLRARRNGIYDRVLGELQILERGKEQLIGDLLPEGNQAMAAPIKRLIEGEFDKVRAMQVLQRHTQQVRDDGLRFMPAHLPTPPIEMIGREVAATGFVDYLQLHDGVTRISPLWAEMAGRRFPQVGLAMACQMLGVKPAEVKIESDRVILPLQDGRSIVIPTHRMHLSDVGKTYDGFIHIPWFGRANNWQTMYDYPAYRRPLRYRSLLFVWDVIQFQERLRANNRSADQAIQFFYAVSDPSLLAAYQKKGLDLDDAAGRLPVIQALLKDEYIKALYEQSVEVLKTPDQIKDGSEMEKMTRAVKGYAALPRIIVHNEELVRNIARRRNELADELAGKAVLIGWTATGAAADFVPTPLHAKCPGPIVHGAIFNSILNGDLWKATPGWITTALALLLGVTASIGSSGPSPLVSSVSALLIVAFYIVFNGYFLFDYGNRIVGMAAPLSAALGAWLGCVVLRWIFERAERARITRRFRSYVDPALVNYVIEHPEQTQLSGQQKELTVVFTDLAGFTTISEKLGPATVPLLNEYMGLMVPVIRQNNGYVNKFLGDGIMFFYGSPRENALHAGDAIATVMKMQELMPAFNEQLKARGLTTLKMRAGITSGPMVVGDAGPPDASDFTVLGDNVNLAARLESANKATGTLIMMNDRCAELVRDLYLLRPMAKLQVVGKTEGVITYEPLAFKEKAAEDQKRFAEMSTGVFDAFQQGRFARCMELAGEIQARYGPSKLCELYLAACRRELEHPSPDFDGVISLTEK